MEDLKSSPRRRGCSWVPDALRSVVQVFPAQAGVIPESRSPAQSSGRLPRTSRDAPIQGAVHAMGLAMSQHKQG